MLCLREAHAETLLDPDDTALPDDALAELLEHCTREEYVTSHRLEPGDTVVCDNRALIHRGTTVERPRTAYRLLVGAP